MAFRVLSRFLPLLAVACVSREPEPLPPREYQVEVIVLDTDPNGVPPGESPWTPETAFLTRIARLDEPVLLTRLRRRDYRTGTCEAGGHEATPIEATSCAGVLVEVTPRRRTDGQWTGSVRWEWAEEQMEWEMVSGIDGDLPLGPLPLLQASGALELPPRADGRWSLLLNPPADARRKLVVAEVRISRRLFPLDFTGGAPRTERSGLERLLDLELPRPVALGDGALGVTTRPCPTCAALRE